MTEERKPTIAAMVVRIELTDDAQDQEVIAAGGEMPKHVFEFVTHPEVADKMTEQKLLNLAHVLEGLLATWGMVLYKAEQPRAGVTNINPMFTAANDTGSPAQ